MRELIYDHAGGIADGRELKAVIPGGSSVPALTPDQIDVPLDYDSLGAIGTFFGAASLIVVDDRCCMVQLALRSTKFYTHESCGKCTPCRVGTRWMVQILESIESGTATHADLELLETVGDNILGKVLCALGEFAVYPVDSYLKKWRDEFVAHVEQRRLPVRRRVVARGDPRAVRPARAHARRPGGARMSTELVRVTIDERDVHVPKGTGIVETALAAGIEIPVFCYEPRLGAPVGACRMCLVEVEGMPKLQTGCTLHRDRTGWS